MKIYAVSLSSSNEVWSEIKMRKTINSGKNFQSLRSWKRKSVSIASVMSNHFAKKKFIEKRVIYVCLPLGVPRFLIKCNRNNSLRLMSRWLPLLLVAINLKLKYLEEREARAAVKNETLQVSISPKFTSSIRE